MAANGPVVTRKIQPANLEPAEACEVCGRGATWTERQVHSTVVEVEVEIEPEVKEHPVLGAYEVEKVEVTRYSAEVVEVQHTRRLSVVSRIIGEGENLRVVGITLCGPCRMAETKYQDQKFWIQEPNELYI